jgi:hypothetical protein
MGAAASSRPNSPNEARIVVFVRLSPRRCCGLGTLGVRLQGTEGADPCLGCRGYPQAIGKATLRSAMQQELGETSDRTAKGGEDPVCWRWWRENGAALQGRGGVRNERPVRLMLAFGTG